MLVDDGGKDFDSFYRSEVAGLVGLAYALCGDISDAEDIAQETFSAALRKWEVVALTSINQLSLAEVADVLGISKSAANTHLRRARDTLRPQMEDFRYE